MEKKRALIFGASGFIGGYLLDRALASKAYDTVIVVVRHYLPIEHPKLTQYIADHESLPSIKHLLIADDVFCAVGTTKKKTPDKAIYHKIDYGFPVDASKIAKENGAKAFFFVSSVGADANSSVFYLKTKGEAERDIIKVGYDRTHIFRPAALIGDRKESRKLEKIGGALSRLLSPLLRGPWKKFRPINGADLAEAMLNSAQTKKSGVHYYYWDHIKLLS